MCLAPLRPLNFSKEKKEKKRKSSIKWRFLNRQVFLKKYYPTVLVKTSVAALINSFFWKCMGGDFFQKPVGLELDCLKTGTYLYFLFIYYFFCFVTDSSSRRCFWKGYQILGQKKTKINTIPILFLNRNLILFLLFDFVCA